MIRSIAITTIACFVVAFGASEVSARHDEEVKRVVFELYEIKKAIAKGDFQAEQRLRRHIESNLELIEEGLRRWKAMSEKRKRKLFEDNRDVLSEVAVSSDFFDIAHYTMKWFHDQSGMLPIDADNVEQTAQALHYAVFLKRRGLNNFDHIAPAQFNSNYFTYGQTDHKGASKGQDVKFQISVKTKIFRAAKGGWGWVNGLTFGYTQLSIFDINGRSSPFRATNYNPDVLFVWDRDTHPWVGPLHELRLSLYDHNSTGVDSSSSRRWERMYIEPVLVCGWLTARAKFWMETPYKDGLSSQNEDIEDYLGKGRLSLQLEPSERLVGEVLLTRGDEFGLNYAAEVSWRPGKLDFFLFLQYYNGYGEELIDYNVETKSLRGGIRFN